jgi:hypothetical protein
VRSVGPGEDVFDAQLVEEGGDGLCAVSLAVVADELADPDAEGGEVGQSLAQELGDAADLLLRHDLGAGHARSVIDGHMDELPTGAGEVIALVAGDAVTSAHAAAELFDVDMEKVAGVFSRW